MSRKTRTKNELKRNICARRIFLGKRDAPMRRHYTPCFHQLDNPPTFRYHTHISRIGTRRLLRTFPRRSRASETCNRRVDARRHAVGTTKLRREFPLQNWGMSAGKAARQEYPTRPHAIARRTGVAPRVISSSSCGGRAFLFNLETMDDGRWTMDDGRWKRKT
jgi:hypothetical protein